MSTTHGEGIPDIPCNCERCLPSVASSGYDYSDSPDVIAEHLRSMLVDGSTTCPLCGNTWMHTHTPLEIVIYRNGVKYGRSLKA